MKRLLNQNITFLGMDTAYEDSSVVVFGAPFDGTTSYRPGTRFAAKQMRVESDGIETYSPRLDLDLEDYNICDIGDVELSNGNTVKILSEIEQVVERTLWDGKKPFMIGGEHLVTLPAVKAILKYHPDMVILHFDAHTDLRETYNNEALSHATVIRRVWDLVGDNRIYQFGIRSGMKEEFDFALKDKHTTMEPFTINSIGDVLNTLGGKKVYV
ncbi:MAG TPA: agmatinase, partial [Firmicutes bacterium]|nr:agmatinase [Bacillota bacterium]